MDFFFLNGLWFVVQSANYSVKYRDLFSSEEAVFKGVSGFPKMQSGTHLCTSSGGSVVYDFEHAPLCQRRLFAPSVHYKT